MMHTEAGQDNIKYCWECDRIPLKRAGLLEPLGTVSLDLKGTLSKNHRTGE